MDGPRTGWNSGVNRFRAIYRHPRPGSPIPATGSSAELDNERVRRDRWNVYADL